MAEGELGVEVLGKGRDIVLLHSLLTDRSSFVPLARAAAARAARHAGQSARLRRVAAGGAA